jgi:molybdopterin synthase catalytic subunit/molybdopterin converting factor small subunit
MRVRVVYLGMLREYSGKGTEILELNPGARISDLWSQVVEKYPKFGNFQSSIAVAINQEYAAQNAEITEGAEVAFLPPVSGGAEKPSVPEEVYVRIVRERIVPHSIIPLLERPEDGAIVIFDGVVRNYSRGRRTLYLEYEAYEPMALKLMQDLASKARSKFAIRNVAFVHRLGHLEIGESSVLIAVYSAHRAAAFEACRWLIDTLKKTVPIYKKEFFEDGAVWADGEPFPDEISRVGG